MDQHPRFPPNNDSFCPSKPRDGASMNLCYASHWFGSYESVKNGISG